VTKLFKNNKATITVMIPDGGITTVGKRAGAPVAYARRRSFLILLIASAGSAPVTSRSGRRATGPE